MSGVVFKYPNVSIVLAQQSGYDVSITDAGRWGSATVGNDMQRLMQLADMTDESGALGRSPLPEKLWVPAHIEIQGDMLAWYVNLTGGSATHARVWPKKVRGDRPILGQFVRLSANKPEGIVTFARRWGVLDDTVDRVIWHEPPDRGNFWEAEGVQWSTEQGREPLAKWGARAAQVRAILLLAASLHRDQPLSLEDWRIALTCGILPDSAASAWEIFQQNPRQRDPWLERMCIVDLVNAWLKAALVRPSFSWYPTRPPEVRLWGAGLMSALAMQLMAAIGKADSIVLCTECGMSYTPERRPREGERRYCPSCRALKIPQRDAARASRDRRKK